MHDPGTLIGPDPAEREHSKEARYRNCPFYGFSLLHPGARHFPFILVSTGGNQCALLHLRHAPCYMEQIGLAVDWQACENVQELRMGAGLT